MLVNVSRNRKFSFFVINEYKNNFAMWRISQN